MRLPEQRLWDAMKGAAPSDFWLQRVENVVTDGMPDVHGAATLNNQSWIELKAPRRPKRATTPLMGNKEGLRPSQINWHVKAHSLAMRSYVLIRDDEGELFLLDNSHAKEVNQYTVADLRCHSLAGDWPGIFEELMSC